jgi:hypothetical protein
MHTNDSTGFVMQGADWNDFLGSSVSGAGMCAVLIGVSMVYMVYNCVYYYILKYLLNPYTHVYIHIHTY